MNTLSYIFTCLAFGALITACLTIIFVTAYAIFSHRQIKRLDKKLQDFILHTH